MLALGKMLMSAAIAAMRKMLPLIRSGKYGFHPGQTK